MTTYRKRSLIDNDGAVIIINPVEIITGETKPTNTWIDGKRVYVRRVSLGNLPNATTKNVASGLPNMSTITVLKAEGGCMESIIHEFLPIPFSWGVAGSTASNIFIGIVIQPDGSILIRTSSDRSNYIGYLDIYFIKNN